MDVRYFRQLMAERGIEKTPTQAEEVAELGEEFLARCLTNLDENPNVIEEVREMQTPEGVVQIMRMLANSGIETTHREVRDILNLYLKGLEIAKAKSF